MQKIKLQLSVEKQLRLGDMLQFVVLSEKMKDYYLTEYYVLTEWYESQARRFLFGTAKPFVLSLAQAYSLWTIMKRFVWTKVYAAVATDVLWQFDCLFTDKSEKLKITNRN